MSRLDLDEQDPDRYVIGHIDSRALAADFMMSRTHMQRLFAKAAQHRSAGWEPGSKRPSLWVSRDFVQAYCRWQAIKFAYVDEAFHWVRSLSEERLGEWQRS
jgi:hypothetical protein